MHKDFLTIEKTRCLASTSLPLSMPPTLSPYNSTDENESQEIPPLPPSSEVFEVVIQRNSLGLGLSIMGGPDALPPFQHLFRVKKLFPLQPAWQTGQIMAGDILLKANDIQLSGLSLRQALDVLRCSPQFTKLVVCRPPPEFSIDQENCDVISSPKGSNKVFRSYSYTPVPRQLSLSMPHANTNRSIQVDTEMIDVDHPRIFISTPEVDQSRVPNLDSQLEIVSPIPFNNNGNSTLAPDNEEFYGEFVVVLRKVNGSLGFSLFSQNDDSTVLRHSVKAVIKDPALSDGRIKSGDKLISANNIECGHLSHEELIQFLRKCPEEVTLKFYRDNSRSQTPVSTPQHPSKEPKKASFFFGDKSKLSSFFSSNSSSENAFNQTKPKQLRPEAKEMVRSLQACRSSFENGPSSIGNDSNASSRGGSRRKIRPFSPNREKSSPVAQPGSVTSHFPKQILSPEVSDSPVQTPTVEFPPTPAGSQPDFLSAVYSSSDFSSLSVDRNEIVSGVRRLKIEEMSSDENLTSCKPIAESSNFGAKYDRPTELNLFGGAKRKDRGFVFSK